MTEYYVQRREGTFRFDPEQENPSQGAMRMCKLAKHLGFRLRFLIAADLGITGLAFRTSAENAIIVKETETHYRYEKIVDVTEQIIAEEFAKDRREYL